MRYIVDVTKKQVDEVNNFIQQGKYENFAQFLKVAIENQIYIENTEIPITKENEKNEDSTKGIQTKKDDYKDEISIYLINKDYKHSPVSMPEFSRIVSFPGNVNEDNIWLWGQINRIFPVKLGLRVLLNQLQNEEWINLEKFRDKASDIACLFSEWLNNNKIEIEKYSDKLTAGLPGKGDDEYDEYKSKNRYKNHFLAYMRKDKKLDGALSSLKFVNLKSDDKGNIYIGVTKPGIEFSKISNPVIDTDNNIKKILGEKEIDYYLEHIKKNVPGEYSAILWMLNKLNNGISGRIELNEEMKQDYSSIWNVSSKVLNTQRAGLTARMYELGLIDKVRKGIEVVYILTDKSKKILSKNN